MESVIAALLGIIVGALLKGAVDVWIDERRQRKQERAALRLLGQDLTEAHDTLSVALDNRTWWSPEWGPTWRAWEAHRDLLAARIRTRNWATIAGAVYIAQSMEKNRALHAANGGEATDPLDDDDADYVQRSLRIIQRGRDVIKELLEADPD